MRLGLFQNIQWPEGTEQETQFENAIEQTLLAERLGFHSAYFVEHHFTRHGILSGTLVLLSHIAARTSRIRLGTAVLVLPFHNPARLVEEAATVDLLSKGRLDLGVGRGFQWTEFNGFDLTLEDSAERTNECIQFILKAWTEPDKFDFKGKYFTYNNISIVPAPLQQPHPPVWIGAGSPDSARRAGLLGCNMQLNSGINLARIPAMIESYREGLEECGQTFSKDRVLISRQTHIAETRELAWERFMPYFSWFRRWIGIVTPAPGFENARSGTPFVPNMTEPIGEGEGDPGFIVCSPAEAVEYIEKLEEAGIGNVVFQGNLGGIPQEFIENSINLIGHDVLPRVSRSEVVSAPSAN